MEVIIIKYRDNFIELQVKNIVDLFDINDKSEVTIFSYESNEILFKDRVDYLQYTSEGEMSDLCLLNIISLEVNSGELIIYVK